MGRYYAAADGEPAAVATAIAEHYQPRGAGDALPASPAGLAVALADRLDTLTGIFAIGQKPSGTKDPFALRRAAIGVLRMLREKQLPLDLVALIDSSLHAHTLFESAPPAGKAWPTRAVVATEVYDYIMERLRGMYLEPVEGAVTLDGVTTEAFDAVLATRPRSPLDFDARLTALIGFLRLPEAAALTAANKRIANLLKKSAGGGITGVTVDASRLKFDAERGLFTALQGINHTVPGQIAEGEYTAAFSQLAQLRPAVDTFFDEVMVMDPDPQLRANRLAMLGNLQQLFTGIADLSRLPG
jgi:glycyl-tRNA synthetase beta chain